MEIGFSRKSSAPSRVARTAISMCAWPDIITTGAVMPWLFRSSSSARPSFPGITTSERIRSNVCALASSSALGGVVADRGLVPGQAKGARQRRQRVRLVVNDQQVAFGGTVIIAPDSGKLVGSSASAGRYRLARFKASARQIDAESSCPCRASLSTRYLAAVVAHHRLHDRQAQSGAVLLGGVVGREQALAFFLGQPVAGIGDLELNASPGVAVRIVIVPPSGMASIAFSTRFCKARCSRSGSA